jgi:hypothetical protein
MKKKQPAPPDIMRKGGPMKDKKKEAKKNPKTFKMPSSVIGFMSFEDS